MGITVDRLVEQSRISFDDIVRISGLTAKRVEAILLGRWLPGPAERKAIAKVFDVPVEEIDWGHTMTPRNVRYFRFGLKEDFQGDS